MDFAWVVDALRHGFKVKRKVWAGDPLYIELTAPDSNSIIAVGDDTQVENWPCLDSDIFADDWEEYVEPKRESAAGYISLPSEKETRLPNNPSYDDDEQDSHGGKPVEEPDLDVETNKAIALVARNIAENLVDLLRNPSVQRILQGNANTNHEKED